jgi:hypothetical protein
MATATSRRTDDRRERIAHHRREIARLEREERDDADAALANALLPVLAIAIGDEVFESDFVSESRDASLRFIIGTRSTMSVGKFLGRIKDRTFAGFVVVVEHGRLHNRTQWRLRRVTC